MLRVLSHGRALSRGLLPQLATRGLTSVVNITDEATFADKTAAKSLSIVYYTAAWYLLTHVLGGGTPPQLCQPHPHLSSLLQVRALPADCAHLRGARG